ncbi:MAG: PD-(D/E)XK nuclease family protein [Actinomycetota bacterium]
MGQILFSQPGAAALEALRAVLHDVRGGDPLAPVDVIVPTGVAGVTVRRAVAGATGLANVRFSALPQVAERLAARHLALTGYSVSRPLTAAVRTQAVRATVAGAQGALAKAARHRATFSLLDALMAELDEVQLDPAGVDRKSLSAHGVEALDLFADYRARVGHLVAPAEMLALAIEAIDAGSAPQTQVILYSPSRLTAAESVFLRALLDRDRLSAVLTGSPDETSGWLVDSIGKGRATPGEPASADLHLTIAPDAEEEVRLVVRRVLAALAEPSCRPERIGIAYRSSTPYVRLLREQLKVAGVPHHVPSQRTLDQTIAGRVALGLLELALRDFPRSDVIRWISEGPLVDAEGHHLPASWWDRLSREAGVARGAATWADRLERHAADQERRADELTADKTDRRESHHRRAAGTRALATFVSSAAAAGSLVIHSTSWAGVAESLAAGVTLVLGTRSKVDGWTSSDPSLASEVAIEQSSYDAVLASVAALAELDLSVEAPSPSTIVDALRGELDRSVSSGTTLGRGVLVGPFSQFVGSDLDLLFVVGMTQDSFPPRTREHVILRDADRTLISPELRTVTARRRDERVRWLAVLHCAPEVQLSYPRADTRSQRRLFAAPWFLEQATRLNAGDLVGAGDVDTLDRPWLMAYPSFVASLAQTTTFGSGHELDVSVAMAGGLDALAAGDPRLQRGIAANRSRAKGDFGPWTGHAGPLPAGLRERVEAGMSATSLQDWAICPTSHFFRRVLGIHDLEDRASADSIDARDKGTLVHKVLEQVFGGHLGDPDSPGIEPETPWTTDDLAVAVELLEAEARLLEARGLTGREVIWAAQLSRLRRGLRRILDTDSLLRASRRSWPIRVEAAFGRDGADPLVIDLPTQGRVPFAGYIDRVDATASGELIVTDYKTGKAYGYDEIPKLGKVEPDVDLIDRGRKLQLVLYALAARAVSERPQAQVDAYFWFVEQGALHRGGIVDDTQATRLLSVLDVVVRGIREGIYPANPGTEQSYPRDTWEACSYCPYDRVCPSTRLEQWRGMRANPAVRPYADIADPQGLQQPSEQQVPS